MGKIDWAEIQPRREKIKIDKDVVKEYLQLCGIEELPKNVFEIVTLNNTPPKEETTQLENLKLSALEQYDVLTSKFRYAIRNRK